MANLRRQLAKRLKSLQGDLMQEEFAHQLGIDRATLTRIRLEQENITLNTIQKICDRLKCEIGWLFDGN